MSTSASGFTIDFTNGNIYINNQLVLNNATDNDFVSIASSIYNGGYWFDFANMIQFN